MEELNLKNKLRIIQLKKELRRREKYFIVISVCNLILFGIVIYLGIQQLDNLGLFETIEIPFNTTNPLEIIPIEYNISLEDQTFFKDVFSNVNPLYLIDQQKIKVVYNISEYCEDCNGININNGELIVVEFKRDKERLERIICHEFFHTFVYKDGGDLPRHEIIYDLGIKGVCFF